MRIGKQHCIPRHHAVCNNFAFDVCIRNHVELLQRLSIQDRWSGNLFVAKQNQIVDFFVEKNNKFFVFANKLVNARKTFVDYSDGFVATALNRKALRLIDAIERRANLTGE